MDTTATQGTQGPQGAETADLSTRTVVTLVVLTLVVSFLGAWMNVNQALTMGPTTVAPAQTGGTATAQVSFAIQPPARDAAAGMVAFRIEPPTP